MIFSITEAASHFALCKITVGVCVCDVWCVCDVCVRVCGFYGPVQAEDRQAHRPGFLSFTFVSLLSFI